MIRLKIQHLVFFACLYGFLCIIPAQAKPLYLTVTRDFSSSEDPVVQVDYLDEKPMEFRVLVPENQKAFIEEQVDLKRAWRQPRSRWNPGRFFLRGFNWSMNRFSWLRRSLSEKFRAGLIETLGGNSDHARATTLPVGPRKLISMPEHFRKVTEFTLHPASADDRRGFDVPGFTDEETPEYGAHHSRLVKIPRLDPGFYVLQVVQGQVEGQVVLVVNELLAQLQQSGDEALIRVANRAGTAVAGASVELRSLQGKWVKAGKTDESGTVHFPGVTETDLITVVQAAGNGTAIIDSEFFASSAVLPDVYLYTDRPMYRPGDRVSFRGLTRGAPENARGQEGVVGSAVAALEKRLLALRKRVGFFRDTQVEVSLVSSQGEPVAGRGTSVQVGEFGSFEGNFKVPESGGAGPFRVTARLADERNYSGEIRVKDYVKPEFRVEVTSPVETIQVGKTLTADVVLERYAGGVPAVSTVKATLIRERVSTPDWIHDAGMEESGSEQVYSFDAPNSRGGETSLLPVVVWTETDIPVSGGRAKIEIPVTAAMIKKDNFSYVYRLQVLGESDGNFAQGSTSFQDLVSKVTTLARFVPVLAQPGEKAWLEVQSLSPGGKPMPEISGEVRVSRLDSAGKNQDEGSIRIKTDARGRARVDVPMKGEGRITVEVELKDDEGALSRASSEVIAMAQASKHSPVSVSELELLSQNRMARVGETARILALLPAGWGAGGSQKGNIYITTAGARIHQARVQTVDGTASWIEVPITDALGTQVHVLVSYPGPRGWLEKRFSIGIPPVQSLLVVHVDPVQKQNSPGGEQQVDIKVSTVDGKPVKSEVSLSVVDKKVLDLQPEFRPEVPRFFFPPQGLNLMTFQSAEFQAYGWGEVVARQFRSNYGFAATKDDPNTLREEDTAFWVATAQTDMNGKARLSFRLPANQTIWVTSVLASDREGRVGEGRSEFKSRMPVKFIVNHPRALRPGESSSLRVKLANPERDGVDAKALIRLNVSALSGVLLESPIAFEGTLKPGEERILAGTLRLADMAPGQHESAPLRLASELTLGKEKLQFEHAIARGSDRESRVERMQIPADQELRWELPSRHSVEKAQILVSDGLTGALLRSVEWLKQYPHGCVEQFTSRLAALSMASQFGMRNTALLSPVELEAFKQAGENVRGALTELKGYEAQQGFKWFNSEDSDYDTRMSLLVYLLLASDRDLLAQVIDQVGDRFNGYRWSLDQLGEEGAEAYLRRAIGRYVHARFLLQKNQPVQDWMLNGLIADLKLIRDNSKGESGLLTRAFLLLALRNYPKKVAAEAGAMKPELEKEVLNDLRTFLKAGDHTGFSGELTAIAWPGHQPAMLSVLGASVAEAVQKEPELLSRLTQQIMASFNGDAFGSTFDTAITLTFSRWIVDLETRSRKAVEAGKSVFPWQVVAEGQVLAGGDLKASPRLGGWTIDLDSASLSSGGHRLRLQGGNAPLSRADLRLVRSASIQDWPEKRGKYGLKRRFFLVDEKTNLKAPLGESELKVRVGDLVYIELSLDPGGSEFARPPLAPIRYFSSPYLLAHDTLPSGLVAEDEDSFYEQPPYNLALGKAAHVQRRFDRSEVRWYLNATRFNTPDRDIKIGYLARVQSPGIYWGGTAGVEDFYDESNRSQTSAVVWKAEAR